MPALLAVFLSSGLRRAEAAALEVADYDAASGRLHIRGERPEYDRLVDLPIPARKRSLIGSRFAPTSLARCSCRSIVGVSSASDA